MNLQSVRLVLQWLFVSQLASTENCPLLQQPVVLWFHSDLPLTRANSLHTHLLHTHLLHTHGQTWTRKYTFTGYTQTNMHTNTLIIHTWT